MSNATTKFVYVTYIAAAPEAIFEAITRPEIARQYWGHENVSDWMPGSKWEHVRSSDPARPVRIAGNIVECDPPRRMVFSWAAASDYDDAARHSRVAFDLEPYAGMVKLTVTHDELADGSEMARNISNGWPRVLSSLKSFLETGKALDVFAQPKAA